MAKTHIEHTFDCTEETLWKTIFSDDEFARRFYIETLHFPVWRLLDRKTTDETLVRKVQVEPRVENLPAPVKKLVGDRIGYVEEGTLDRKSHHYHFQVTPSAMPDKTHIGGEMWTERVGESQTNRIVDFSIEVKIMMLGKIVEQKTIDDTRVTYDRMATFLRSYLKEKSLSTS